MYLRVVNKHIVINIINYLYFFPPKKKGGCENNIQPSSWHVHCKLVTLFYVIFYLCSLGTKLAVFIQLIFENLCSFFGLFCLILGNLNF